MTNPDKATGRGMHVVANELAIWADKKDINIEKPVNNDDLKKIIDNINQEEYSFLNLDIDENEDYIPKTFSFRKINFFNQISVLITIRYIKERKDYEKKYEKIRKIA